MADLIKFDGGATPDKMAEALRSLKANLQTYIEYHEVAAQLTRAKFDALVKSGFSEAQALELSKTL